MPREFDSKRSRSDYDRDPSPRRSRRDGKPATERSHGKTRTEDGEIDEGRKQRRLQDPLPLERSEDQKSKLEVSNEDKGHERRSSRSDDRRKQSDPVSRSRSFSQHDEPGTQEGRTSRSRATLAEDRRQKDTKEGKNHTNSTTSHKAERGDKKPATLAEDNQVWRHDKFHETESDQIPSSRKRRPFREEKPPIEPETAPKLETAEKSEPNHSVRSETEGGRIEDKGNRFSRFSRSTSDHYHDRDRTHARDGRMGDQGYRGNGGFVPRDRYGGGGGGGGRRFNDRERFGQRPENRFGGGGDNVEKWKHDLFDQVETTTNHKKEEDPVAKVEALLAL